MRLESVLPCPHALSDLSPPTSEHSGIPPEHHSPPHPYECWELFPTLEKAPSVRNWTWSMSYFPEF